MNEKTQDRETLDLPSQPGTYALLLEATAIQDVPIGKLGVLHMLPGIYVYVGSALGPGGLAARVGRHALREKALALAYRLPACRNAAGGRMVRKGSETP